VKCRAQGIEELTSEKLGESPYWHQEVVFGCDPATTRQIDTSCWDNDMEMGMEVEFLVPCMKDCGEADLRTKSLPAFGKIEERLRGSVKEHGIEAFRVLEDQWIEFMGESEDHMEVVGGQESIAPREDPASFSEALTLWTVSISTRVEREAGKAAPVFTYLQMTTEGWGSTHQYGPDGLALNWIDRMGACVFVCVMVEDVSQFQRGSGFGWQRLGKHHRS
jgi:hypothetical protein